MGLLHCTKETSTTSGPSACMCTSTCFCKVALARPSLGDRDSLLSHDGSRLRSSELQRDTSGDRRWRRSFDRPLSWLLVSLWLILGPEKQRCRSRAAGLAAPTPWPQPPRDGADSRHRAGEGGARTPEATRAEQNRTRAYVPPLNHSGLNPPLTALWLCLLLSSLVL